MVVVGGGGVRVGEGVCGVAHDTLRSEEEEQCSEGTDRVHQVPGRSIQTKQVVP